MPREFPKRTKALAVLSLEKERRVAQCSAKAQAWTVGLISGSGGNLGNFI